MGQNMRIPYIPVDKYVAAPFDPSVAAFPDSSEYYLVTLQVYNDDGSYPTSPVAIYMGGGKNGKRIQFWDQNKNNLTDTFWNGGSTNTDDTGQLILYVAVSNLTYPPYPGCIWELFASLTPNPNTTGISQTLTCCYSDYTNAQRVASKYLDPLVLATGEGSIVTIPAWNKFQYSQSVQLNRLSQHVNPSAKLSIVVNGKLIDNTSYTYQSLQEGVEIPYDLMKSGNGDTNVILYITDDGTPYSAPPWQFTISGVPLLMPDPNRQAMYTAPWWIGAQPGYPPPSEPLTIDDLYGAGTGPGFNVVVPWAKDVQPGDIYRVYIYQNGYTVSDGTPHTLLLGDGNPIKGLTWDNILEMVADSSSKWGGNFTINAPVKASTGFAEVDANTPGYLWVNYQINGQNWSAAYVGAHDPVDINFGDDASKKSTTADRADNQT